MRRPGLVQQAPQLVGRLLGLRRSEQLRRRIGGVGRVSGHGTDRGGHRMVSLVVRRSLCETIHMITVGAESRQTALALFPSRRCNAVQGRPLLSSRPSWKPPDPMFITKPFVTDRRIRFALVGCGRISENHFAAIEKHADRAELVGVCDIDPAALARAEHRTGAPGFRSLDALLAGTDADIVILATPSGLHADQAIQVAAAGRHVMTEKPMATRWHDGKRMVHACDQAGVHLFVVKQNRRNATLQLLKRAVEKGRFGRIYMVNINVFWSRPQSYYDSAPVARNLGVRWRCLHEPGEPLRGSAGLAHRSGRKRSGLYRHPGAKHPGRGHRRGQHPVAHWRAGLDERHHADLSQEPRGLDHDHRREGHGPGRRRRGQPDRPLGVCRHRPG